MTDIELSTTAKALLRAAKSDGPSAAARAKIWSGVASSSAAAGAGAAAAAASGTAAGAAAGAGAAGEGSIGGAAALGAGAGTGAVLGGGKLMIVGALFGSAVTVGLAATLVALRPIPQLRPDPQEAPIAMQGPTYAPTAGRPRSNEVTAAQHSASAPAREAEHASAGVVRSDHGRSDGHVQRIAADTAVRAGREDTLMRESALVAEARGALIRGDAEGALASLRVTHMLKERALEPEELSIEARALRALGRDGEAMVTESLLKSRYPDHALSR